VLVANSLGVFTFEGDLFLCRTEPDFEVDDLVAEVDESSQDS